MNRRKPAGGGPGKHRPGGKRPTGKPTSRPHGAPRHAQPRDTPFRIVERHVDWPSSAAESNAEDVAGNRPFRVLIAVHRPRFRGRAERAAALIGWEVTALLNKQDPVGLVAKPPSPPDLLILSGDFGRQRDYAIFRAVQAWRSKGMKLIGLVEDCETPPEGFPDSVPEKLCDICLTPPYKTADFRALFIRLYEQIRGEPAPPPRTKLAPEEDEE